MTQTVPLIRKSSLKTPQTVVEFEIHLLENNDKRKLEFRYGEEFECNGVILNEIYLYNFILRAFSWTLGYDNDGELFAKAEIIIDDYRKRIADLAHFTEYQIITSANGINNIPNFVIEFEAEYHDLAYVKDKIQDYFDAGVQVVWYISPKKKLIYVYTSPSDVKIYKGEQICHARPALLDFEFKTEDLFVIPTI